MRSGLCLAVLMSVVLFRVPPVGLAVATLYQQPTLSQTSIVFAYGGDLWTVAREGGSAQRLTTGTGVESSPRFSPDGLTIAFTGEYDGNTDVYILPSTGGVPERLTYHPVDDVVVGWSPDGRTVLFRSTRESTAGYSRLFTVPLTGELPTVLPLPLAFEGALSSNESHLAYQPISQWQRDWKRHQGGQRGYIQIVDLRDSRVVDRVAGEDSNDTAPFWMGEVLYFLSDRNGSVTLFAYDPSSKEISQVLANNDLDIKSVSGGPDAIVYEQFGTIWLLDPATGQAAEVAIEVTGDFSGVRPRYESVGDQIANGAISPSGARAVFEARGEILTVPAEKGDPRNLTQSPGVMERDPAWSPDGKWIAYFSDASGEYALRLRDQKGEEAVREIDLGKPPSFFYSPVWSPDSKKIAYSDRRLNLWYIDIEDGTPVKVDENPIGFSGDVLSPSWSADSGWITYARFLPNLLRAVFVYSIEEGSSHQITDSLGDATYPQFDKNGKYLYFSVSTDIGRSLSWADLSGIDHVSTRSVYAAVLRKDLPSPLAPESDEEEISEDEEEGKDGEDEDEEEKDSDGEDDEEDEEDEAEIIEIDFEGIDQRIIALPIPAGNIQGLVTAKEGILFVAERPSGGSGDGPGGVTLHRFDLEEREVEEYQSGVRSFDVSADGEKMLFRKGSSWTIAGTSGEPPPGEGTLNTSALEVRVEPSAEWRQMFQDAWRGERDHFYDPGYHGLDIEAASRLYEPYLESVIHRADLNYLFREMLNQLTIGHMFIFGGDVPRPDRVPGGLLGCDYSVENGRYRFARIFNGENWNPDLRAPLTEPGITVETGEYLLAVGGRALLGTDNVHRFFENTADKQVVILVGSDPDGSEARNVTIVPVPSERALRNRAWMEDNRRRVDELSDGRLAYIYIPNTGGSGYASFNRYFFAQTDKQGAVVDERFNGGGLLADYVANYLSRSQLSAITFRYKDQDIPVPAGAIYGPKAMLINSMAGSGGDAMPWYFRKMNVGPLIGKRTWGGLVAARSGPRLMDGGGYTAPDAAVYGLNGEWEVENVGVAPDIEVDLDPAAWRQGHDLQLERAVEYLLEELKKNPRPEIKRPEYPKYERSNGLNGGG